LEVFREPLRAEALAGLAFKTIDLALADERLEAFFDAFGFTFALVAMDVRNLYGLCPLKSKTPPGNQLASVAPDLLAPRHSDGGRQAFEW